jgi:hypothetical protein
MKRNLCGWLILSGLLTELHTPARAQEQDKVVLLEDSAQPPRPGLSHALRIQLLDVAAVDVRQWPETSGFSERIQVANGVAAEPGALVVVWAEPTVELPDGSREAVLYVVGREQGRALMEIVRVPGGSGPDVDRSLAIKVGEVVHEVRTNRERAAREMMLEPAPAPASALPPPHAAAEPAEAGWGLTAALGAVAGPLGGSEFGQWGMRAGAGAAYRSGDVRISGLAELSWFPRLRIARGSSQVRFDELGPGLLARAQLREGSVWLGLRTGAGLSWIDADAQSASSDGEASELVATWLVGFDAEIEIVGGLGLAAAIELQGREPRRRFAVEGEHVVDLGRLRPLALLALTFHDERVR